VKAADAAFRIDGAGETRRFLFFMGSSPKNLHGGGAFAEGSFSGGGGMRHKLRKLLWGVVLLCFTLAFPPWSWAYVSEDYSDLPGIKVGDKVSCVPGPSSKVPRDTGTHDGKVTIVDSNTGRTLGQGMLLNFLKQTGSGTDGYTFIQNDKLRDWIAEFGGNVDFVRSKYDEYICRLTWGSKVVNWMWVGDLAKLCGTGYGWYDQASKTGYFAVTKPPNASISGPSRLRRDKRSSSGSAVARTSPRGSTA